MNKINKLLCALGESEKIQKDKWTQEHTFQSGEKKWVAGVVPKMLLERSVKDALNSIMTLSEGGFFDEFPKDILTPDYSDKWGVSANYIEINNRAIAQMQDGRSSNGILSMIKILPAIIPSAKSWANCIIWSQIFPNIFGDGVIKPPNEENSIYGIRLNASYSVNIVDFDISDKITPEEQIKAFNELANFRGIKTTFRAVISADQIKVAIPNKDDEPFKWDNPEHQELYIKEHVKLMDLGFEGMFVDSAKHIGGYDMEDYAGVGSLPGYEQMQYILNEIRLRSHKTTLSFMGEKSTGDFARYKNLGLTTGTAYIKPDDIETIKKVSEDLKYNEDYSPGIEVSNDNDEGGTNYETRLKRISNVVLGYQIASDKLPSFMQMEDIFPLRYDTSTHHLMMSNPSYSEDGTPESHWENLFAKDDGQEYNKKVAEIFQNALNLG